MIINPEQLHTYKPLFSVRRAQTTSVLTNYFLSDDSGDGYQKQRLIATP
jgi:hypothetical protein